MHRLKDKRILVAVTGGIACYKVCTLVSRMAQGGAEVTVMMTESATRFVTPLTFESLSGRPVLTSLWEAVDHHDAQHIGAARGCDLAVIAPVTANVIAKLATGICDDVVTTVLCALPPNKPVVIAPAMNEQMWENPVTRRNVATVRELLGYELVGPGVGWQACRTQGAGRMSEPEEILNAILNRLTPG